MTFCGLQLKNSTMSVFCPNIPQCSISLPPASPIQILNVGGKLDNTTFNFEGTKERIKKMFNKVQLSISSYDTAWVAMVPSPNSLEDPFFPQCVTWLLQNQHLNGSWGLPHHHTLYIKDALLSTLSSVLALKRWSVGEQQINKGLHFIESNLASASYEGQHSPIGFDIVFPTMLEYAQILNLNIPLEPLNLDSMIQKRDLELERAIGSNSEGVKAYLAYVSEGMGRSMNLEMVMKFQRKNGSLFNSPATTAAAFTNLKNSKCLNYLVSVLENFKDAVPTIYPLDIYARLCMVDIVERLGIDGHFREEIGGVLDETYKYWIQEEEDLFLDPASCALSFRLLRVHGYDVSSIPITKFSQDHIVSYPGGNVSSLGATLELFKASQLIIYPDEELVLEKQNIWASHLLKQELSITSGKEDLLNKYIFEEVNEALKFPFYANLERLSSRRAIDHYNIDSRRILKTSFSSLNIGNENYLKLAAEDFNQCQSLQREELKSLASWVIGNRLDKLSFARQKLAYCYFSAAATLFTPELSDARISWAKNGVLTTVVDDFFDIGGSEEELLNLIGLVEKWDSNISHDCCSEQVEIIFSAIHSTISEIGAKASIRQGRNVTNHLIEIWLDLLKSMLKEAEWLKHKSVPTIDEYMKNAYISFALGPIVLPALYFVGPKLSNEVVKDSEFHRLFKLMSTCGRLLNDMRGFKRESAEGKLNAVTLGMTNGSGCSEEQIMKEMRSCINSKRRELLRLVLLEDTLVPRACKELFWKMTKVVHLFYAKDDGFTSNEMTAAVKSILEDPIVLSN